MFTDECAVQIFKERYSEGRADMLREFAELLREYSSRRYNNCLSREDIECVIAQMEKIEKERGN